MLNDARYSFKTAGFCYRPSRKFLKEFLIKVVKLQHSRSMCRQWHCGTN